MFADEMELIDRAMSVDSGFSRYLRSRHLNAIDPFRADVREKNPNAHQRNSVAAIDPGTGRPWWEHSKRKGAA